MRRRRRDVDRFFPANDAQTVQVNDRKIGLERAGGDIWSRVNKWACKILETALSAAGIPWFVLRDNQATLHLAPSLELLGVGDMPLLHYSGLPDFWVI
jgi:hypothetical protein